MKRSVNKVEYKIILLRLGLSQREIANQLGYSESYISQIIAGKRKCPEFNELIRRKLYIAELKGVNI